MASVEQVGGIGKYVFTEAAKGMSVLGNAQRTLVSVHDAYAGVSKETSQADMQTATNLARIAVEAANEAIQSTFEGLQKLNDFGSSLSGSYDDSICPPRQKALGILRLPIGEDPEADRAEVDDLRRKLQEAENSGNGKNSLPGHVGHGGSVDVVQASNGDIVKIPHIDYSAGDREIGEDWDDARQDMNDRLTALEITKDRPCFEQMTRYVPPNDEEDAGAVFTTPTGQSMDTIMEEGSLDTLNTLTPEQCDNFMDACEVAADKIYVEPAAPNLTFHPDKGLTFIDASIAGRPHTPREVASDCIHQAILNGPCGLQLPAAATTLYDSYKRKFGDDAARTDILAEWKQRGFKLPPGFVA